jgi:alpha-galactosidase
VSIKITMIGAGSTVFMKNLIGDALQKPSLCDATICLMDIDRERLEESALVASKMVQTLGVGARIQTSMNQQQALEGADFVIVAFQIGGYDPCTIIDFEVPKRHGLRQTIADTLGVGGIMRGVRTVPHLWAICEDMLAVCPDALMLQYVNPMAINTAAIAARYPTIRQVGLCHSVQGTAEELARDLAIPVSDLKYKVAGVNHVAFFLELERRTSDGWVDAYPALFKGYAEGRYPTATGSNPRCPNKVRYEVMKHLGHFCTESSEHLAEYVPWFIKRDRPDLIEQFGIPLDEYPRRCEEQVAGWKAQAQAYRSAERIEVAPSHEYAASIMDAVVTGRPAVIHGNIANRGYIPQLPDGCAVEVACLVDRNGVQPTRVAGIAPQLIALMRSQVNVQELVVAALVKENVEHIYHAAMMDPHTAAELDLRQIRALIDEMITAHQASGNWLPDWVMNHKQEAA